ncbi:DUF2339 domain-containing protein [Roseateles cellulosilyticus]|uniref:DUF2339 domain-containing protein n=1 Tax=Pelomonas cellulosilytica TaxID=2906762 RepID=A0ABS8XW64_9BURK|nr:DUF2339 domain-containing protein [Pelomonas sp. P8]MCE4556027.1 DUF2339 domain-containing protein [Pelomonas sp. P8]
MQLLALLLGALFGGLASENFGGALLGAVIGWLGWQQVLQGRRIAELERQLAARPASARSSAMPTADVRPVPGQPVVPPTTEAVAPRPQPVAPLITTPPAAMPVPGATPQPMFPPPPARPPRHPVPMPAWAQRLAAANTIVKVGLAMLFLGLVFLARFAAENVTLPLEVRLAGIGATGVALLAIGWRLRLHSRGYGLLLQGGGVAVVYLTLFAAVKLAGLQPLALVFALMLTVSLLAALLAVRQDAQALAVVAAMGGYATPLLLSTGGGSIAMLLGYDFVLGLGVALVAWFKHWPRLNLVAFGFTALIASAWGLTGYTPADYGVAQGFLVAFWLLFTAVLLMPGRHAQPAGRWLQSTLLFGVPVFGGAMQYALLRPDAMAIAVAALVIGSGYAGLAAWARRRAAHGLVFEAFIALAAVFGTLVIPFALSAEATAGAWALEGLGAVWLGLRQQRLRVLGSGLALVLLGGLTLAASLPLASTDGTRAASQLLNALLIAAAGLGAARCLSRMDGRRWHAPAAFAMVSWGTLWLGVAAAVVLRHWVPEPQRWAAALAFVAAGSAALLGLQALWRWPVVAWPTAVLLPAWTLLGAWGAVVHGAPLQAGGVWALPLALLAQARVLHATAPHWPAPLRHATHAGSLLAVALLGALEARHWTADFGDAGSAWGWLGWLVVPTLLLAAVLRQQRHAPAQQAWPLRLAPEAYAQTGAGLLSLALSVWALVANWASPGSAQPLPYVPLLSPLDLGIAAALLAVVTWLRGPAAAALRLPPSTLAVPASLAFLWLNGMLIRCFHHWGGVPYHLDGWLASRGVQTGLALLWSALALVLMLLGTRRGQRVPWLAGAVLLGAVVLKLMLIDLQGSGTVLRIVSFIGVGVLMLVIGYVAPLPGAATTERHETPRH